MILLEAEAVLSFTGSCAGTINWIQTDSDIMVDLVVSDILTTQLKFLESKNFINKSMYSNCG
jgi:DNA-binding HxlR family transcriptional regulator